MRNDAPSQTISMLTLPFYTRLYFNCYFLWWELEKSRECENVHWIGLVASRRRRRVKARWKASLSGVQLCNRVEDGQWQGLCSSSRGNKNVALQVEQTPAARDLWGTQRSALLAPTVSSKFLDVSNSMIYDLKRSADLKWLVDPVVHCYIHHQDKAIIYSCEIVVDCSWWLWRRWGPWVGRDQFVSGL